LLVLGSDLLNSPTRRKSGPAGCAQRLHLRQQAVPPCARHLAREALLGIAQLALRSNVLEQLVDLRALPQLMGVLALAAIPLGGPLRSR
jgi:hypothetical protein